LRRGPGRPLEFPLRGKLYTYNGFEQLIGRVVSNSGTANGTTFFVHDMWGNVIAELNATGATVREYIYLPETEISPTRVAQAAVDRPVAVVSAVNTASPQVLMVHVDQLNRPVLMTNSTKASVWQAVWTPWGTPFSISGAETLDSRFPGQWFQLEAGLHYNWYRHYDPSLGRYSQPDPLGFVDGPSVYAYADGNSLIYVDQDGRIIPVIIGAGIGLLIEYTADQLEKNCGCGGGSYSAAAAAGGSSSDIFYPDPKTSRRLGDSTEYLGRTTRFFNNLFGRTKWPGDLRPLTPTWNNPLSRSPYIRTFLGRWTPIIGAGYLGYDLWRIGKCLGK
jgi:RHS repeat-associated protein